ncbi:hypothetical protein LDB67_004578, partial [Salmonella enterica]|nr:hypothetical protein [Salmonella enterica]
SFSKLLSGEQLKEICIYIVALSSEFNLIDDLDEDVETCLRLKDDSMEELIEMSLYIEKSRILFERGSFNASFIVLQDIIKKTKFNSILGFAFRNLARLSIHEKDFENYTLKAIDHFLISGLKHDAVSMIMLMLERIQGKDNHEALALINKAIELQSSDSSLDKDRTAALYQKKGSILIDLEKYEDAKEPVITACSLRRGLIGGEMELHASLIKLEFIYRDLKDDVAADKIKEEYMSLESHIDEPEFFIARDVAEYLREGDEVSRSNLSSMINEGSPVNIKFGYAMAKYLNEELTFTTKVELLDQALKYSREMKDYHMTSLIFQQMAEEYHKNEYVSIAIEKLYESLSSNKSNKIAFQNIITLLLQEKRLEEASCLLKQKIEEVGQFPNITYIYAKVRFELKDYKLAYKLFKQVRNGASSENIKHIDDYIMKCIENIDELVSEETVSEQIVNTDITLDDISKSLDDFCASVSSHSRMLYWNKCDDGYKWASKPETIAKHALIMFFSARFSSGTIELIQEPRAGAGFIDIYLVTNNGIKVVIELKMCGNGYSSNYALSGESQILHYLESRKINVGFLVVFDSRTRDFSKGIQYFKSIDNYSIFSKVVDVRSILEK